MKKPNRLDVVLGLVFQARDVGAEYLTWKVEDQSGVLWIRLVDSVLVGREAVRLYLLYNRYRAGIGVRFRSIVTVGRVLTNETKEDANAPLSLILDLHERPIKPRVAAEKARELERLLIRLDDGGDLDDASDPDLRFLLEARTRRFLEDVTLPAWQSVTEATTPSTRAQRRNKRVEQEATGWKSPVVPLLRTDDAQLRALVALRCLQQQYAESEAHSLLRDYARAQRLRDSDGLIDEVIAYTVQKFTVDCLPDGLPCYLKRMAQVFTAERAESAVKLVGYDDEHGTDGKRVPPHLVPPSKPVGVTPYEFATRIGVSKETVYNWIRSGKLVPAQKHPYLLRESDIDRLRECYRPGDYYRAISSERHCSYDAARVWLKRQEKRGMSPEDAIRSLRPGSKSGQRRPDSATKATDRVHPRRSQAARSRRRR